jgi:dihydrofolate reductase
MSELRSHVIAMSLDGYMAGPQQTLDTPLGEGGERLHEWMFVTSRGREMIGQSGGTTGIDDAVVVRSFARMGATIMGRNMFGPVRGPWAPVAGEEWRGWWGEDPPYHHPVFVLTHHAHEPIEMQGGTTFHFVTDGIESALEQARDAAGDDDVRLSGGAETIREYLRAGLVDELNIAVVPVLLGAGERIFDDLGDAVDRYACVEATAGEGATHYRLRRRA